MSTPSCISCGGAIVVRSCPGCGADLEPGTDEHAAATIAEDGGARRLTGRDRDRAAALRDRGAEERDSAARVHELDGETDDSPHDILARAARDREQAATDRARAADDRAQASSDRDRAAAELAEALAARSESADLLVRAGTDELTGARTRLFGLDEASREIERARRTGSQLMLAFVDVDGLKQLNDTLGHQAGDALLAHVGRALRGNLRPYDVIVRYGGDEFVCAMPDLSPPEARARFKKIAHALSAAQSRYSISFGLAQAWPGETLTALVARADADLLAHRSRRKRIA